MQSDPLRIIGRQGKVIAAAMLREEDVLLRTGRQSLLRKRLAHDRYPTEKLAVPNPADPEAEPEVHKVFRLDLPLLWEVGPLLPDLIRQLRPLRPAWFTWIDEELVRHRLLRQRQQTLQQLAGAETISWAQANDGFDALPAAHPWHRLRSYQQAGVRWLRLTEGRTVLGDDMGLGKTIQTLVWASVTEIRRLLVVCPSVVVHNWQHEATIWAPEFRWIVARSAAHLGEIAASPPPEPFALSMSWGLLRRVQAELLALRLQAVVADEIHYVGNLDSQRTQALLWLGMRLGCDHRVGLTGTEVRNRPREVWPLLRFADPLRFRVFARFGERFCGARWKDTPNGRVRQYEGKSRVKQLNKVLRGYVLRREKREVLPDVPPKTRQTLVTPTSLKDQARWARTFREIRRRMQSDGSRSWALGQLGQMRQEVGMAKVPSAVEWITDARTNGEAVVVFVHHTAVCDALVSALEEAQISVTRIVGATPMAQRPRAVQAFQDGDVDVIVGSTAMKEGVTLHRARYTLHVERFWVAADEEQAEDRVCRIGQTRPVWNVYLHVPGSVDDYIAKLVDDKRALGDALHDRTPLEDQLLSLVGTTA